MKTIQKPYLLLESEPRGVQEPTCRVPAAQKGHDPAFVTEVLSNGGRLSLPIPRPRPGLPSTSWPPEVWPSTGELSRLWV